ncbi:MULTISPECIES: hypothetical protein [unclassified Dietzia]|uniref:hypothetical protein n=1 Tax=unclassified Dietzia TaxID=2617939 RepID=UPI0013193A9F|nr:MULTISPECIES: hypothetical protein [unclassified Dietzia]QGW24117.1 haloacid dehalogenase [Dietzia sp. DQ12-45-1b]
MTDELSRERFARQDHPANPGGPPTPSLIIFDVNETLSDMSPMARRFEDVGAPAHLASSWFAGLLRDGFALTVVSASDSFATSPRSPCGSASTARRSIATRTRPSSTS